MVVKALMELSHPRQDSKGVTHACASLSEPRLLELQAVGPAYLAHWRRQRWKRTFTEDEKQQTELDVSEAEITEDDSEFDHEEDPALLRLDPKEWKASIEEYAALTLVQPWRVLRYKATRHQIKAAHRRKVLRHHPDKKAASGNVNDDAFFKCIQKAYETLYDPLKRRQYDSVDPRVDDYNAQGVNNMLSKQNFFEVLKAVCELEGRFLKADNFPDPGTMETSKRDVESFYDFWYNFDSWRTFEYLDKEEQEGENRDDKRYIEKKNKTERARRKKEDNARLRQVIDTLLAADPRLKKFKEEEKAQREAKRQAKSAQMEAAKKKEEEDRKRKRAEAEKAAQESAEAKRLREQQKQQARKEKKALRQFASDHHYFVNASDKQTVIRMMAELDLLLDKMSLDDIQMLRKDVEANKSKEAFGPWAKKVTDSGQLRPSQVASLLPGNISFNESSTNQDQPADDGQTKSRDWTPEEFSLLIKAVKKFPGGTGRRWEVIAQYISVHSGQEQRSSDELIAKSKTLKQGAAQLADEEKTKLQHAKKTEKVDIEDVPTLRYDGPGTTESTEIPAPPASIPRPWSPTSQSNLEKALKTYPPSYKGPGDRWELIAENVPGRTKKECKLRVKYLADQVKAQKAARAAK
ncbi:hypothetical protein BZG36_03052 [Bifiguratus adelaidae]|uniref:Uncharacterized protein n=1 Tax=Bifiguratus adelaidae TaxID=1938954 RepID=A0A261XYZ1_9FUNG|nr:hypothetical protein BZG36_03052 [Bifiguratus adelaidae]